MSADATTPRPDPDYSYFCDYATRLSKPVEITECSGLVMTFQYSVDRRPRSRNLTAATRGGSVR